MVVTEIRKRPIPHLENAMSCFKRIVSTVPPANPKGLSGISTPRRVVVDLSSEVSMLQPLGCGLSFTRLSKP